MYEVVYIISENLKQNLKCSEFFWLSSFVCVALTKYNICVGDLLSR